MSNDLKALVYLILATGAVLIGIILADTVNDKYEGDAVNKCVSMNRPPLECKAALQ